MKWRNGIGAVLFGATACARQFSSKPADPPPPFMLGEFVDDYGSRYAISSAEWVQLPRMRYHVVRWNVAGRYLVAQNDSTNATDPGRWTRIDWLPLAGMTPYAWGYCYAAYDAPSAAIAESTHLAERSTPRTGCNGFPFSRMQRAAALPGHN